MIKVMPTNPPLRNPWGINIPLMATAQIRLPEVMRNRFHKTNRVDSNFLWLSFCRSFIPLTGFEVKRLSVVISINVSPFKFDHMNFL
jgi:hypothetical protein